MKAYVTYKSALTLDCHPPPIMPEVQDRPRKLKERRQRKDVARDRVINVALVVSSKANLRILTSIVILLRC